MLLNPATGFAVHFEAKVLSDVDTKTKHDALRNQLARNIDCMAAPAGQSATILAQRRPERSFLVLLTPELFRSNWTSRLYGHLMRAYTTDPAALARDLPHLDPATCVGSLPTTRLADLRGSSESRAGGMSVDHVRGTSEERRVGSGAPSSLLRNQDRYSSRFSAAGHGYAVQLRPARSGGRYLSIRRWRAGISNGGGELVGLKLSGGICECCRFVAGARRGSMRVGDSVDSRRPTRGPASSSSNTR